MPPIDVSAERNHECKYCGKLFRFKWNLTEHVRRHENKTPHKCNLCPKSFVKYGDLKNHLKCHSNEKLFSCTYCEKSFKTKQGKLYHEDSHGFNRHECTICKKFFEKRVELYQHKRIHKTINKNCKISNSPCYECSFCWNTFSSLEFKNEHESKVHVKKLKCNDAENDTLNDPRELNQRIVSSRKSAKIIPEIESFEMPLYSCIACTQNFKGPHYLKMHIKSSHPGENIYYQKCQLCTKKISANYFRTHLMSHYNIKPFACTVCDYKFARQHELDYHITTHNKLKLFRCLECNKKFKNKKYLIVHKRCYHSSTLYPCKICIKVFPANGLLKRHIMRAHKRSEYGIKCPTCNTEVFCRDLPTHLKKVHDKVERLCEICGKTFKNAWYVMKHLKYCRKVKVKKSVLLESLPIKSLPIKSFPVVNCPHCKFFNKNLSILRKHCLKNHVDKVIKCQSCSKICLCKTSYEKHLRKHKNIDQHFNGVAFSECYFCGFIIAGANTLAEHLRRHEYSKWLLSWNNKELYWNRENFIANISDESPYLCSEAITFKDSTNSLLLHIKKEISWIHDTTVTKETEIYRASSKTNAKVTDPCLKSKIYQDIWKKYIPNTNQLALSKQEVIKDAEISLTSLANDLSKEEVIKDEEISFPSSPNDLSNQEVIEEEEFSLPSLPNDLSKQKVSKDEEISLPSFPNDLKCADVLKENHITLNDTNSNNFTVSQVDNIDNVSSIRPFIFIDDLKKLGEFGIRELLKFF